MPGDAAHEPSSGVSWALLKERRARPFSANTMFRACLVLIAIGSLGCNKLLNDAKASEPTSIEPAAAEPTTPDPLLPLAEPNLAPAPTGPLKYALPFAWEASAEEPLARTRSFLAEVLNDNAANVARGPKVFRSFAEKQTPRATVVTCTDSRVHDRAWDLSPENDGYVVRNWGNQISNSLGSVQYGVEHLNTPLLLIIGHTGCDAVHAVLEPPTPPLPEAIRKELDAMKLPKPEGSAHDAATQGALDNVHLQVDFAVEQFGHLIRQGELTVVGAVYDYRNELGGKPGTLHLINVNANREPDRLRAFERVVQAVAPPTPSTPRRDEAARRAGASEVVDVLRKHLLTHPAQGAHPDP